MNSMLVYNRDKILVKAIRDRFIYDNLVIEGVSECNLLKKKLLNFQYDFLLLDLSSGQANGMELIYKIRKITSAYLLIIGENNNSVERIMSLERGGDFYIESPLDIMELKAIVDAINRRIKINSKKEEAFEYLEFGDFNLDILNKKIKYLDLDIDLTPKEFLIFYLLIKNPNRAYTREELNLKLWGLNNRKSSRNIDVHIRKIREKLKLVSDRDFVFTRWGEGYYFRD